MSKLKSYIVAAFRNGYYAVYGLFFSRAEFESYKKQFLELPDCKDTSLILPYKKGNLMKIEKPLLRYYDQLWDDLKTRVASKRPFSYIRASDGEAYFLSGRLVGNVSKRHYTAGRPLTGAYIKEFREGLEACDSRHAEMYTDTRSKFIKIYGKDIFSEIPFECIYALISSRRLLKSSFSLGLIGSDKKLEIIKQLLNHSEYQNYIGRIKFSDYISVPETGSSNNVADLAKSIAGRLKSDVDIYLVGIGIAKLAVLHRLKPFTSAVLLDAGAGISALAGLVNTAYRPYFADWTNFRIRNFDYSQVDTMDANMSKDNIIYL